MTSSDLHIRRLIEEPAGQESRLYPLDPACPLVSLLDVPWYPPYTPDTLHYHNCMEIGLCLFGEGIAEAGNRRWPFSKGSLLLIPKGLRHAQHNAGDPFTLWRYLIVNLDVLLAGCPEHCRAVIQKASQTTWNVGLYLSASSPGAQDAAALIRTMFDLRCRYADSALPELDAALLLLLTRLTCTREDSIPDASVIPQVPSRLEGTCGMTEASGMLSSRVQVSRVKSSRSAASSSGSAESA